MLRRAILTIAVFGFLVTALPASSPPNILLFTIDSCRADRFGSFGSTRENTPHIDAWAKGGALFTQAYSTSAWTAPGLVSILSGLYPPTHGVNNRDRTGSIELQTLIKTLSARGYTVPNLNFFTFAPYYINLGLGPVDRSHFGSSEESPLLNWLAAYSARGADRPFFVWFHSTIVHQPYNPSHEDLPENRATLEQSPGIKAVLNGAIVPLGSTQFSDQDRPILDLLYDAEVRRVDRFFGQVLAILKDQGLADNTLIVLTADHGEELLDHGFVGHASTSLQAKLYEEHVRIPLIVAFPGRIPAGSTYSHPVSQIDIYPTVLSLLNLEAPSWIQGRDLFEPLPERAIFMESVAAGNQTPRARENEWVRAVRKGRYKYISPGELYDLILDPAEKVNLYERESTVAGELHSLLEEWLKATREQREQLFGAQDPVFRNPRPQECPRIFTPEDGTTLGFDIHTGALLFDWSGDMETSYLIEYDIGEAEHHVEGVYEVLGNHQLLGPFPAELWENLKAWNPFRIRVTPRTETPCWSRWVEFRF